MQDCWQWAWGSLELLPGGAKHMEFWEEQGSKKNRGTKGKHSDDQLASASFGDVQLHQGPALEFGSAVSFLP